MIVQIFLVADLQIQEPPAESRPQDYALAFFGLHALRQDHRLFDGLEQPSLLLVEREGLEVRGHVLLLLLRPTF